MKKKLVALFSNIPRLMLQLMVAGLIIFLIQGCSCQQMCLFWGKKHGIGGDDDCDKNCIKAGLGTTDSRDGRNSTRSAVKKEELAPDTVVVVGNPIPQKEAPGQIEGPAGKNSNDHYIFPGEYFATTVFAGSTASFMNSSGGYDMGSLTHPPGIGFQFGVGNAFPINKHLGLTSNIRFKQTNGAEKLDYSTPGGGGSGGYKDTYTYNYVAGTIMGQYYLNRHLSVTAGPELNYLLSASMKPGGGGNKKDIKKESTGVGVDMLAGFKYEIPAGNRRSKWGLSLIYDHRLSSLNKKEDNGNPVTAYHMKSVQLGLSYFICNCGKNKK